MEACCIAGENRAQIGSCGSDDLQLKPRQARDLWGIGRLLSAGFGDGIFSGVTRLDQVKLPIRARGWPTLLNTLRVGTFKILVATPSIQAPFLLSRPKPVD
jgi:hypothetical protein